MNEENTDEISCDNSRLRIPTYINDVYFLLVCCPFSWNAVYLRWNVISRVTATDTTGVTAIFNVSPYILPEKRI